MKLLYWEHCPECTKVRLAVQMKQEQSPYDALPFEMELVALNDEKPLREALGMMANKFPPSLPILFRDDDKKPLNSTAVIITYIDKRFYEQRDLPLLFAAPSAFAAILPEYPESLGEIESAVAMLLLPRLPKVGWVRTQLGEKVLPEFTKLGATEWFVKKQERHFEGEATLDDLLAQHTGSLVPKLRAAFSGLGQAFFQDAVGINWLAMQPIDICHMFANLRALTIVAGFPFSPSEQAMLDSITVRGGENSIKLHSDYAVDSAGNVFFSNEHSHDQEQLLMLMQQEATAKAAKDFSLPF